LVSISEWVGRWGYGVPKPVVEAFSRGKLSLRKLILLLN